MTKALARLKLETSEFIRVKRWFDKNKKNPEFKHLVTKAYRDWAAVVHINNKIVKKSPSVACLPLDLGKAAQRS